MVDICSRIPYIIGEVDESGRIPLNTWPAIAVAEYITTWTLRVASIREFGIRQKTLHRTAMSDIECRLGANRRE
jgi:hypothetical protein